MGLLGGVVHKLDLAPPPRRLGSLGRVVTFLPSGGGAHQPPLQLLGGETQGQPLPTPARESAPPLLRVTFTNSILSAYARSTQNTCSSDSLWPQRPFTSAPRVSEISACSVISWEHRCPAPPQRTRPRAGCKGRRVQTPGCTPGRSFARARAPRSRNMRLGAVRADPAVREAERGVTFKAGRASRRRYKPEPPCSIQKQPAGAQGARRTTQVFIGP